MNKNSSLPNGNSLIYGLSLQIPSWLEMLANNFWCQASQYCRYQLLTQYILTKNLVSIHSIIYSWKKIPSNLGQIVITCLFHLRAQMTMFDTNCTLFFFSVTILKFSSFHGIVLVWTPLKIAKLHSKQLVILHVH